VIGTTLGHYRIVERIGAGWSSARVITSSGTNEVFKRRVVALAFFWRR
jgi:hypothetical protein